MMRWAALGYAITAALTGALLGAAYLWSTAP